MKIFNYEFMKILKNEGGVFTLTPIDQSLFDEVSVVEIAKALAVAYQSVFAGRIWNEAAKDNQGNPIGIEEIKIRGGVIQEAYFPISVLKASLVDDIKNSFTSKSELILLVSDTAFDINQEFSSFVLPEGEFPFQTSSVNLLEERSFVTGFSWGKQVDTLEILKTRGGFNSVQAISICDQFNLQTEVFYASELGVIDALRKKGCGRFLLSSMFNSVDGPICLNTSLRSPAFKILSSFGFEVLNGPDLFDREGYVFMLKNN